MGQVQRWGNKRGGMDSLTSVGSWACVLACTCSQGDLSCAGHVSFLLHL